MPPANLHLTLRFCGHLPEATLAALEQNLRGIRGEPFDVRLGALGTFGGRRRPRVVWLGLAEGLEPLREVAAGVEAACRDAGLEAEGRPYRAHLTLARALERAGAPLGELPEPPSLPAWTVSGFTLYRSRLGRGPAVYEPLERFPLGPRAS